MSKCIRCGKKGLFLKVNAQKYCADCVIIEAETKAAAAVEKAKDLVSAAENKVRCLEQKAYDMEKQISDLTLKERTANLDCAKAEEKLREQLELLAKAKEKSAKYKTMASSIKAALSAISNPQYDAERIVREYESVSIAEALLTPELNCLTIKELRSRYTTLRKQIVDVCTTYEDRYTTKANATIYRLMVLALEAELENILYKLQFGKLETATSAVRLLTAKYYTIASEGNQSIAPTIKRFIAQIESLYLDVVETEYEYYVQRERAKEEQRAIKEQMRQEAEERKRLEQERKKIESEELKYKQEIERITAQMQQAHDDELEKLRKRLEEMNSMINKVEEKKAEIINLQNGKAGTVYIISNIGSFGDQVFKIGMTRRLEPQDRVNELGDASVPFPFDVHSFIFSEDAVALETALHHELNNRRVNKVNLRKEFFNVNVEELQKIVERIDPTAPFKVTALAEQYRQSLSIDEIPDQITVSIDEE